MGRKMRSIAWIITLVLTLEAALGADLVYKAPPEHPAAPPASPCGNQGYVKVRLVEGRFSARTVQGREVWVEQPDTVMTVCADGRVFHTQVSQSILPFNPEIAALPGPELGVLAAAAAAAVVVIGRRDDEPPRPVSP